MVSRLLIKKIHYCLLSFLTILSFDAIIYFSYFNYIFLLPSISPITHSLDPPCSSILHLYSQVYFEQKKLPVTLFHVYVLQNLQLVVLSTFSQSRLNFFSPFCLSETFNIPCFSQFCLCKNDLRHQ